MGTSRAYPSKHHTAQGTCSRSGLGWTMELRTGYDETTPSDSHYPSYLNHFCAELRVAQKRGSILWGLWAKPPVGERENSLDRIHRPSLGEAVEGDQGFKQVRQRPQRHHGRPLGGGGVVGILMRFDEDGSDADRRRGTCEYGREFALASRSIPKAAGLVHGMRGVEDDWVAGLRHDRQCAHIDDECIVAEARAALA